MANNWHGYVFEAHATEALSPVVADLRSAKSTLHGGVR